MLSETPGSGTEDFCYSRYSRHHELHVHIGFPWLSNPIGATWRSPGKCCASQLRNLTPACSTFAMGGDILYKNPWKDSLEQKLLGLAVFTHRMCRISRPMENCLPALLFPPSPLQVKKKFICWFEWWERRWYFSAI